MKHFNFDYSSKLLIIYIVFLHSFSAKCQETITTIYGDNGGFFTSSTGSVNTYNDSNNLLGFISDGVTYSTGVNDATLTANSISFTPSKFLAFPMPATITNSNPSLVGIGYNWDGVNQTNAATDYIKTFSPIVPSFFVRDGSNGLELSSNYFNIPVQTITYDALVINQAVSINDAKPDIIATQTGQPNQSDKFKFVDTNGNTVGSELTVAFSGISRVGITAWTIYRVNPTTGVVASLFGANTTRDLRMISFNLSDFGITVGNFSNVSNFVHTTSGNTDIAFTAYNNDALEINLPDTDITVSNSSISADDFCTPTTATFVTTITNSSLEDAKDFEVDFTLPTGITSTTSSAVFTGGVNTASYSIVDGVWSISGIEAGESVTLTVNATASGTEFPLSFTVTATLDFQTDTNTSNNEETITEIGLDNDCDGINDATDLDDDNDGILDTIEGTGDLDGDGIPNNLDLDSDGDGCPDALEAGGTVLLSDLDADFVINGSVNANGVPTLPAAGSGSGQTIGDSQLVGVRTCDTTDTDGDSVIDIVDLDDDNDGILDTVEGTGNTDGSGAIDALDTDSDGDGCPDALEGGGGFTLADVDANNMLTGGVDANGIPLVATANGQTLGDSQNAGSQSSSCDLLPVIISQVYQTSSDTAIELTNIGANTVTNIRLSLFKDIGASDPTSILPTASITIANLTSGNSVVIKSIASLSGVTLISAPDEELNASVTDIAGTDDIIILSTTTDNFAWANRYDVVSNIEDETSLVRIDEITEANTTFTASEWITFVDDNVAIVGDTDPIPSITRHANAPLLSDVKTPIDTEVNRGLGLHRINPTVRTGSAWSNGSPDKSRKVIIQENYDHTVRSLNARILDVQGTNILSVENQPIIVINNTNINTGAEIRILGTGQFVQVHEGFAEVTGNGKLLVSQKSELPNVYRYNYWSSPVLESLGDTTYKVEEIMKDTGGDLTATSTVSDIDFVSGFDGATGTPIQISSYWIWAYFDNSTRDNWVQLNETSYLDEGLGFTMKSTGINPQYFTFQGSPIDGDISFNISGNTTSLLGNPYAGTLDANAFILNNENTIDGTLYFWEHTGETSTVGEEGHSKYDYEGGYAQRTFSMGTAANSVVTGTAGLTPSYTYKIPSRYIAIGQGFFVSSDSDGGAISFNNKQRSYQATEPEFFKSENVQKFVRDFPIIKLGLDYTNENNLILHRQIGVSFKEEHSYNFDYGYEAEMIDVQETDMYWSFKEMNNKKLVIAGIKEIDDTLQIPLTITKGSKNAIFIRIDEILNTYESIYLHDALENTTTELSNEERVELNLPVGTYEKRFFIVFHPNVVLETNNDISIENSLNIFMNTTDDKLTIINKNNLNIKEVEAINILGQTIKTWNSIQNNNFLELDINEFSSSIYIIKVTTDKGVINKKILK